MHYKKRLCILLAFLYLSNNMGAYANGVDGSPLEGVDTTSGPVLEVTSGSIVNVTTGSNFNTEHKKQVEDLGDNPNNLSYKDKWYMEAKYLDKIKSYNQKHDRADKMSKDDYVAKHYDNSTSLTNDINQRLSNAMYIQGISFEKDYTFNYKNTYEYENDNKDQSGLKDNMYKGHAIVTLDITHTREYAEKNSDEMTDALADAYSGLYGNDEIVFLDYKDGVARFKLKIEHYKNLITKTLFKDNGLEIYKEYKEVAPVKPTKEEIFEFKADKYNIGKKITLKDVTVFDKNNFEGVIKYKNGYLTVPVLKALKKAGELFDGLYSESEKEKLNKLIEDVVEFEKPDDNNHGEIKKYIYKGSELVFVNKLLNREIDDKIKDVRVDKFFELANSTKLDDDFSAETDLYADIVSDYNGLIDNIDKLDLRTKINLYYSKNVGEFKTALKPYLTEMFRPLLDEWEEQARKRYDKAVEDNQGGPPLPPFEYDKEHELDATVTNYMNSWGFFSKYDIFRNSAFNNFSELSKVDKFLADDKKLIDDERNAKDKALNDYNYVEVKGYAVIPFKNKALTKNFKIKRIVNPVFNHTVYNKNRHDYFEKMGDARPDMTVDEILNNLYDNLYSSDNAVVDKDTIFLYRKADGEIIRQTIGNRDTSNKNKFNKDEFLDFLNNNNRSVIYENDDEGYNNALIETRNQAYKEIEKIIQENETADIITLPMYYELDINPESFSSGDSLNFDAKHIQGSITDELITKQGLFTKNFYKDLDYVGDLNKGFKFASSTDLERLGISDREVFDIRRLSSKVLNEQGDKNKTFDMLFTKEGNSYFDRMGRLSYDSITTDGNKFKISGIDISKLDSFNRDFGSEESQSKFFEKDLGIAYKYYLVAKKEEEKKPEPPKEEPKKPEEKKPEPPKEEPKKPEPKPEPPKEEPKKPEPPKPSPGGGGGGPTPKPVPVPKPEPPKVENPKIILDPPPVRPDYEPRERDRDRDEEPPRIPEIREIPEPSYEERKEKLGEPLIAETPKEAPIETPAVIDDIPKSDTPKPAPIKKQPLPKTGSDSYPFELIGSALMGIGGLLFVSGKKKKKK